MDRSNSFSGSLTIYHRAKLLTATSLYAVLPFRITGAASDNENLWVASTQVDQKCSIVNIVAAASIPSEVRVRFQVDPTIIESKDVAAAGLQNRQDFLVVEHRTGGRFTLYFRFGTNAGNAPVGRLAPIADGMLRPEVIEFRFPADTDFYNMGLPHPSNAPADPADGLYSTPLDFYLDKHLWINYDLPGSAIPAGYIIFTIAAVLSGAAWSIVNLPEEMLSKAWRLRVQAALVVLVTVLWLYCLAEYGLTLLLDDTADVAFAITAAVTYFGALTVLLKNAIPDVLRKPRAKAAK